MCHPRHGWNKSNEHAVRLTIAVAGAVRQQGSTKQFTYFDLLLDLAFAPRRGPSRPGTQRTEITPRMRARRRTR